MEYFDNQDQRDDDDKIDQAHRHGAIGEPVPKLPQRQVAKAVPQLGGDFFPIYFVCEHGLILLRQV